MKIKLNYNSDSDWCIQQLDDNEEIIGEYVPSEGSVDLTAKTLEVRYAAYNNQIPTENCIFATLMPWEYYGLEKASNFNSNVEFEIFQARILRMSEYKDIAVNKEMCRIRAKSDWFSISAFVSDETYNDLIYKIENKLIDTLTFEFNELPGLYEPKYSDGEKGLKVFRNDIESMPLEKDGVDFSPPALWEAEEFSISTRKKISLESDYIHGETLEQPLTFTEQKKLLRPIKVYLLIVTLLLFFLLLK